MASDIYGIIAEFKGPDDLVHAAHAAHKAGYRCMDAYTPFPIEDLNDYIGPHDTGVPRIVAIFGFLGATSGFIMQYVGAFIDYPLNVGGRALNITAFPAFIPITFESGILLAAFSAVFGMLTLNGLPLPYHPVFNTPRFERASQDAFFLCIESKDPLFERGATAQFLRSLRPLQVNEVEP